MEANFTEIDMDLAQLLGTMSLDACRPHRHEHESSPQNASAQRTAADPDSSLDATMSDSSDSEDSTHHSHPSASPAPASGCGYLQAIQAQVGAGQYPTTGGAYLEAIFTHRETFAAFPQGHRTCAIGFADLARTLEQREWRADWEGDGEAVAAFRHEAWVIANAWQ